MKSVICFGEVLWDLLPSENIPGGAPMNVAVHLNHLGIASQVISCVGNDELGAQLLSFLNQKGVNTSLIQIHSKKPTSVVKVILQANNDVTYQIVEDIAWDYISHNKATKKAVKEADILVFGSLATRNDKSRNTLLKLLPHARLRVFDANLRPPFYTRNRLESLLAQTDILKINHEELQIIGGWYTTNPNEDELIKAIRSKYALKMICLTKGSNGAILYSEDKIIVAKGYSVILKDTVGSGDAFLAGFLTKIMAGRSLSTALQFACATGSLVATYSGAVPTISQQKVMKLINVQA